MVRTPNYPIYSGRVPATATARATAPVVAVRALARLARTMERASGDLGLAQYRVLSAIAGGDDRASRIAAKLSLGRPTLSASVDALCRRGLVTRTPDARDQRAVTLRLTAAGAQVLASVEAAMVDQLTQLAGTSEERDRLVTSLTTAGAAIERQMATGFRPAEPS